MIDLESFRRCPVKILMSTDGSEYSGGAARFLTRLNLTPKDEIIILHVISSVPFKDKRASYYASLKEIKQEIAPKILDSAVEILKPLNVRLSTAVIDAYPDRGIIDVAVESGADLIVMGARGLKGIKSIMVGSVTRAVAVNSPLPVLIIKPPQWEIKGTLKILYTTDGSDYSKKTGNILTSIPFPEDTEVTILNVNPATHISIPDRFLVEVDDRVKKAVARIREAEATLSDLIIKEAREILGNSFKKTGVSLRFGDPSIEILNEASSLKADIIAMGSSGLRGIKGMLGSVSRYVLGHSECSVLIGKTDTKFI